MADRCQASITIGGALPAALLSDFIRLIQNKRLATERDGVDFDASQLPQDDNLRLMANDVAWGCFSALEAFCVEQRLPFVRWTGGCPGSWDAERVVFKGAGATRAFGASDDDYVLIGRHTVEALGSYAAIIANFDAADFVVPPFGVRDYPARAAQEQAMYRARMIKFGWPNANRATAGFANAPLA